MVGYSSYNTDELNLTGYTKNFNTFRTKTHTNRVNSSAYRENVNTCSENISA